jgi:hypothetical protein
MDLSTAQTDRVGPPAPRAPAPRPGVPDRAAPSTERREGAIDLAALTLTMSGRGPTATYDAHALPQQVRAKLLMEGLRAHLRTAGPDREAEAFARLQDETAAFDGGGRTGPRDTSKVRQAVVSALVETKGYTASDAWDLVNRYELKRLARLVHRVPDVAMRYSEARGEPAPDLLHELGAIAEAG